MKNRRGFTIVEIIIVITVIAILSSLAMLTFERTRTESRDAARSSNVTIISEALERYYEKNGEYPSVASLTNENASNTGEAIAAKLSIPAKALTTPRMPGSTTNALTSNPDSPEDYIAYIAKSQDTDADALCKTDINGGCDEYTLQYSEESSEDIKIVESRHRSRTIASKPDLEVSVTSTTSIDAEWSTVTDATSYELQRSLTSDFSSPVTTTHLSTSSTASSLAPDTEYFFRVRALLPGALGEWSDTQSATTTSIATPAGTLTIAAAMSGANAQGTAGGGTCPAGATMERQIRHQVNTGAWSSYATGEIRDVPATSGYKYTFQQQARCIVGGANGPWAHSTTASVIAPVAAPSGLTITAAMSGTNARGTAGGGTCPAGTAMERQIRHQVNTGAWTAYTTGVPRDVPATPGYQYTFQQQARCVGTGASSSWATSSTAAVIRPVTAPSGLTITATMSGANARGTAGGGACVSGTTIERQIRYQINAGAWTAYTAGTPRDVPATPGYQYTFQQQARCNGTNASSGWVASGAAVIVSPITAPSGLTIAAAMSGTNARGTAGGGSCVAGTALERQIRYQINGNAWSSYLTGTPRDVPAVEGYGYTFQQQARCVGAYASSGWVASGTAATARPVTSAPTPVLSSSASGSTVTWTWPDAGCPAGTTTQYRVRRTSSELSYDSGWGAATTTRSWVWAGTEGYVLTVQVQAQCVGEQSTGPWGSVATRSHTSPVLPPAAPTNFTYYLNPARTYDSWTWTAPSCKSGQRAEYFDNSYITGAGWHWVATGQEGWRYGVNGWSVRTNGPPTYGTWNESPYPWGNRVNVQHKAKYVCINTTTGRVSADGPVGVSALVTVP